MELFTDLKGQFLPVVRVMPRPLSGVVLVAVTVLGVMAAVMINTDADAAPTWMEDWGWALLVVTFTAGGIATALIVATEAWHRGARALKETVEVVRHFFGR